MLRHDRTCSPWRRPERLNVLLPSSGAATMRPMRAVEGETWRSDASAARYEAIRAESAFRGAVPVPSGA